MRVFGITGWQNSGKTTLMIRLINHIKSLGFSVSTIKHAHHNFDIDKEGKDSYRHREAGASEVLISSANRWALIHELQNEDEPSLHYLLSKFSKVDLVLIEGFKTEPHPKLEVYRKSVVKDPIWLNNSSVVAIATDMELDETFPVDDQKVLDLNDVEQIANFILDYVNLKATGSHRQSGVK